MTLRRTHFTPLCLACLEGIHTYFNSKCAISNCCNHSSTKKIVGISTISRKEHSVAQTREIACTREVLADVISRGKCCFHECRVHYCMFTRSHVLHVHCTCTLYMYLCVFHEGLNITEVAHDYNTQLKTYITQELKLVNSFDTWHGMCISAVQAT